MYLRYLAIIHDNIKHEHADIVIIAYQNIPKLRAQFLPCVVTRLLQFHSSFLDSLCQLSWLDQVTTSHVAAHGLIVGISF